MHESIDISKLDKAEVLAALYNNSRQQGMGFIHSRGAEGMTVAEAQKELEDAKDGGYYFDYLHGRVMKISLKGDHLDTWGYDRDNGQGAAARAIADLQSKA